MSLTWRNLDLFPSQGLTKVAHHDQHNHHHHANECDLYLDLLLGEGFTQVAHHTGKLLTIDETVSILRRRNLIFDDQHSQLKALPRQTLGMPHGSHPLHSQTLAKISFAIYQEDYEHFCAMCCISF